MVRKKSELFVQLFLEFLEFRTCGGLTIVEHHLP